MGTGSTWALVPPIALGGGTVEFQHGHVDGALVKGVHTLDLGSDHLVDVLDGLQDALATVTALVTVTQLECLVLARGCATGNRCTAHVAALKGYLNFYSRIATRIQNLSGMNLFNIHNEFFTFWFVIMLISFIWLQKYSKMSAKQNI